MKIHEKSIQSEFPLNFPVFFVEFFILKNMKILLIIFPLFLSLSFHEKTTEIKIAPGSVSTDDHLNIIGGE